jgi:hypothetical protein
MIHLTNNYNIKIDIITRIKILLRTQSHNTIKLTELDGGVNSAHFLNFRN